MGSIVRFISALVFVVCNFVTAACAGESHPRYFLGGQAQLMSAGVETMTPLENNRVNLGFVAEPLWIFFPKSWLESISDGWLHLSPQFIDEVDVFRSLSDSEAVLSFGDTRDVPDGVWSEAYGYGFSVADVLGANGIWLRVSSQNSLQLNFDLVTESGFKQISRTHLFNVSLVLGVSFFYLAWAVVQFLTMRESLALWYMVRQVLFALTLIVHSGLTQSTLGSDQDAVHNWLAIVYILVAQLFDYQLLRRYEIFHWLDRLILLVIALFPLKAMLMLSGQVSSALLLNNVSIIAGLSLVFVAAWFARPVNADERLVNRVWLLWFYGIQLVTPVFLVWLAMLEQGFDLAWLGYSVLWYGAVHGAIILGMLSKYYRRTIVERERLTHSVERLAFSAKLEREKTQEVSDLISMLGHELKTPISTMKFALSSRAIIGDELLNRSIDNIAQVIDQCVQLDELGRAELSVRLEPFDLGEAIEDSKGTNEEVQVCGEDKVWVNADPFLTRSILTNLFLNAQKYKSEGEIRTQVVNDGLFTIVEITNRVEANLLIGHEVFQKYYRHPSSRKTTGTGLGLYLSRRFAEKMGGDLTVFQKNSRVTFRLSLPRAPHAH